MKKNLQHFWETVQEENMHLFPFFIIAFLIFSFLEEFKPGLLTFYFSEWWILVPVLFSGIIFAFTDKQYIEANSEVTFSWKNRLFLWIFFLTVFIGLFIWKIEGEILWIKIVSGVVFLLLFAFFSAALLFSDEELSSQYQFWKKVLKWKFYILILFSLAFFLFLFFWALFDPFFWNLPFKKQVLEWWSNIDTQQVEPIKEEGVDL